jgi:hypothetical protein
MNYLVPARLRFPVLRRTRAVLAAAVSAALSWGAAWAAEPSASQKDLLLAGFRNPPDNARPRVWWHWMNGNITADGITKDLQWMRRVGIAGVQNFDAALQTPQMVEKRLVYMSPPWKEAFRHAVEVANHLGMEFAIASSPGWSESGGPWVSPAQAMKKLVWSETVLEGRARHEVKLPVPPSVTGPYQDIALTESSPDVPTPPDLYQDSAVIAFPIGVETTRPRPQLTVNGAAADPTALLDGDPKTGIALPAGTGGSPGTLEYTFPRPLTIRSAVVYVAHLPANSFGGQLAPRLEASDDAGVWHTITDIRLTNTPTTASFAPVTARKFRLLFIRTKGVSATNLFIAPGVDASAMSFGSTKSPAAPLVTEFRLSADPRVNAFEQKAGFAIPDDYYSLDGSVGEDVVGVSPDSILDLTGRMEASGTLDWKPPAGRWKVLRLGFSLTGKTNHPATPEATGLEVDKYDGTAVASYLETYLGMYRDAVGDGLLGKQGIRAIVTDSIEVGPSNWTASMLSQFQQLRGYDPRPWLPTLTGTLVGSRTQSDAFLYDFRRTLADLMTREHYGQIARVAHEHNLTVYGESLEGTRSVLGDDIEMRRFADIPMAAMWTFRKNPQPAHVADMRGAASAAHLYGRSYVAAESLTSVVSPWAFSPADLQPMIDVEFANGINRPVIHTSVHQPLDDKLPGLSLKVYGQYFNRHETWAEMARPWVDYMARNSYLLQQGHNVADVLYFYGEDEPIGSQGKAGLPGDAPEHYAYDFLSPDALLSHLTVEGGDLVATGGAHYKLIYLGGRSQRMSLAVLRRLAELAEAGATIVGDPPEKSVSLQDDSDDFRELVHRLWSGAKATNVAKGQVITGKDVEGALAAIGVGPDFTHASSQTDSEIPFLHRRLEDGDIYFVANRADREARTEARFRIAGKAPEIWRADTGTAEPISYRIDNSETAVLLQFAANESFFVVFRRPANAPSATVAPHALTSVAQITGPWDVAFQAGRGAPSATRLQSLGSLSDQADPGIKYFSGIATYTNTFTAPKGAKPGIPLWIDLGRVGDVAEVRINGEFAGTVWKAPYRLDIAPWVRRGRNGLDIRVADLWVNRLIGDAQPGAEKIAFTTTPTYTAKAPLRPSGLIGPVKLLKLEPEGVQQR